MTEQLRDFEARTLSELGLISTSYAALVEEEHPDARSVRKFLAEHHEQRKGGRTRYYYVVNRQGQLSGVIHLDKLTLANDEVPLKEIMIKDVYSISAGDTATQALNFLRLSALRAFPVVVSQDNPTLLGVLDWEFLFERLKGKPFGMADQARELAKLKEDLGELLGFDAVKLQNATVWGAFVLRAPWLLVTLLAGLTIAWFVERYHLLVAEWPVIAGFIALVVGLADAVCHQASTIAIIQDLGEDRSIRRILRALWRELNVATRIGVVAFLLLTGVVFLWRWQLAPAIAIGCAAGGAILSGALIGLSIPTLLRLLRKDPHASGGPIALALADIVATLILLQVASMILM